MSFKEWNRKKRRAGIFTHEDIWNAALANQWVPVSERLPELNIMVDVVYGNHRRAFVQRTTAGWWDTSHAVFLDHTDLITHWMPIPPLPGGGE